MKLDIQLLVENMEFLILGQSYFSWSNHKIESPFHAIFVRYKWNF